METPRHDIEIHQGANFKIGFSYLDSQNIPINLTGWTARMQIRVKVGGRLVTDLSTENGMIVIDPLVSQIDVDIPKTVTRTMAHGLALYDLFIVSPQGFAVKLIEGEAFIVPSVTRG